MLELIENYWLYFLVGQYPNGPLGGLTLTILIGLAAMTAAFPVGVLFGLARISVFGWIRWPVTAFIYVIRGTPLLMVVFWAYFFLPSITGHKTDQFTTMLVALIIFNGAYIAEIVRAGIQSVPKGQMESARSLGMSYVLAMRKVILPQALRNMRPSLVNQFVSTLKETSLGYIIGLTEVSFIASQINTQVMTQSVQVYGVLALTYFILCFGLSRIAHALEPRTAPK